MGRNWSLLPTDSGFLFLSLFTLSFPSPFFFCAFFPGASHAMLLWLVWNFKPKGHKLSIILPLLPECWN